MKRLGFRPQSALELQTEAERVCVDSALDAEKHGTLEDSSKCVMKKRGLFELWKRGFEAFTAAEVFFDVKVSTCIESPIGMDGSRNLVRGNCIDPRASLAHHRIGFLELGRIHCISGKNFDQTSWYVEITCIH